MPRLPDEVAEEHLLRDEYSDLEGLPPGHGVRGSFEALQTSGGGARPKWSTSSPRRIGGDIIVWDIGSRLKAVLAPFQPRSPRTIILLLAVLKFAITTSGMLLMIPLMRLIEDGICHKHYRVPPSERIPEMKCKVDEVQTALAWLGGWQSLIGAVVSMVVAFPYGILSDRIGRKAGLLLAYVGTVMALSWAPLILGHFPSLHIYTLFFGSAFFLVGGGIVVLFNNVYAMAADVSTEKDRASNFVYLSFGAVAGGLIGPVTAGLLMERHGPWVPIRLVFALTPAVFLVAMLLPETLRVKLNDEGAPRANVPLSVAFRESMNNGMQELTQSLNILRNRNILLCFVPSLVASALAAAHSSTLSQYVSKHFGWTLAQTSYLLSPLGLLHMGILVALPWVSRHLVDPHGRFRRTGFGKDALLARGSYLLIATGALLMALSREVVVFLLGLVVSTLGSASGPLARAIITEFVDPEHTSRLYALTSMVDTLGSPLGGPVLAWAFSVGLERGGGWRGLPFFYVSMLALMTWAALMLVREPRKKGPLHLDGEAGGEGLDYESDAED